MKVSFPVISSTLSLTFSSIALVAALTESEPSSPPSMPRVATFDKITVNELLCEGTADGGGALVITNRVGYPTLAIRQEGQHQESCFLGAAEGKPMQMLIDSKEYQTRMESEGLVMQVPSKTPTAKDLRALMYFDDKGAGRLELFNVNGDAVVHVGSGKDNGGMVVQLDAHGQIR